MPNEDSTQSLQSFSVFVVRMKKLCIFWIFKMRPVNILARITRFKSSHGSTCLTIRLLTLIFLHELPSVYSCTNCTIYLRMVKHACDTITDVNILARIAQCIFLHEFARSIFAWLNMPDDTFTDVNILKRIA